jgi:hypothetical protein
MGKHTWVMYAFLLILAGVLLRNAAGSVALLLAGGETGKGLVNALEGPSVSTKGTFRFGGTTVSLGK